MKGFKKRYRIRVIGDNGEYKDTNAFDLETALDYAQKVNGTVYVVYSRPRSNVYMDVDEYALEVKR